MSSNQTYANTAPGATGVDPQHPAEAGYLVKVVDGPNGIVEATPAPRKKFAIVGFAASSRDLAPFADAQYEVWGLNQLYRHIPRASRWFDIHANWREDNVEGTDHPGWLKQCGIPVYMSSFQPELPTCVDYPLKAVMERVVGTDYFTSTVAFMVALAIYEIDRQVDAEVDALAATARVEAFASGDEVGPAATAAARALLLDPRKFISWQRERYAEREIAVYGIDLVVGTEYDWQKACVEYILGLAQARNITLRLPVACALLKQRWRYGYQVEAPGHPLKLSEINRRGDALKREREAMIARLQTIDGALQENQYWSQVGDLRVKGAVVKLNEDT